MGTIEENKNSWSHYDWSHSGDEWSSCWGGTDYLWWGTIFPRIHPFVPCGRVLELAPGYGRCTQYLKSMCCQLTLVDLVENCIEACKQRFELADNIDFHVNDGRSLNMIDDASIDFIFSWDSLVHAEADVMESYAAEFARILKPKGRGFIHHSNMGAHRDPQTGKLKAGVENPHWRAESSSAELFRGFCESNNLICVSQEMIAWGGETMNDVFSYFTHQVNSPVKETRVIENPRFMEHASRVLELARLYQPQRFMENKG